MSQVRSWYRGGIGTGVACGVAVAVGVSGGIDSEVGVPAGRGTKVDVGVMLGSGIYEVGTGDGGRGVAGSDTCRVVGVGVSTEAATMSLTLTESDGMPTTSIVQLPF